MTYRSASFSSAGPRQVNEDSVGIWEFTPDRIVAAVADGLGGMGGGDRASQLATKLFKEGMKENHSSAERMVKLLMWIHSAIRDIQSAEHEFGNMATTLTGVEISGYQLSGAHCGDTRAVVARGDGIRRLTNDHAEGARLFRTGKLSKQEFLDYPRKNILDSALGVHKAPEIEAFTFNLQAGDKIFLTSDGVHQKILLRELREISARHIDPSQFVSEVQLLVEARNPDDNHSLAAIFID